MIVLYGSLHSRANRCAWMLNELGIDFHHEPTNFLDGSTHKPDFLTINPNGRVPALDDDGFTLFESLAINLYLAKKHGGPLAPQTVEDDALMTQWSLWAITEIEKPLLLASANRVLFAAEQRHQQEFETAMGKLSRPWAVLNAHLKDRNYLLGERFTAADLNVASVLSLLAITDIDLSPWPCLHRWLSKCLERPAAPDWKGVTFNIPRPQTALGMLSMFV